MSALVEFLAQHGAMLLCGSTLMLVLGAICVCLQRSPLHKQRTAEVAIIGTLLWLVLAFIPLPRYSLALPNLRQSTTNEGSPIEHVGSHPVPLLEVPLSVPEIVKVPSDRIRSENATPLETIVEPFPVADSQNESPARGVPLKGPQPVASVEELFVADSDAPPTELATARKPPVLVSKPLNPARTAASAFVAGAIACCLWLAFGHLVLRGMIRGGHEPAEWLSDLYSDLRFSGKKPQLYISSRCKRAFSCGVWEPVIVLPSKLCRPDRAVQLRHILLHELAHVTRRDACDRWLFNVGFPLLFFHPLYWWLRRTAEMSAELIADDMAARASTRELYAEQLIALAREHGRSLVPGMNALQILGSHTRFYRRMNMLVRRNEDLATTSTRSWRLVSLVLLLVGTSLGAGLIGVRALSAQSDSAGHEHHGHGHEHSPASVRNDSAEAAARSTYFSKRQAVQAAEVDKQAALAKWRRAAATGRDEDGFQTGAEDGLRQLPDRALGFRKRAPVEKRGAAVTRDIKGLTQALSRAIKQKKLTQAGLLMKQLQIAVNDQPNDAESEPLIEPRLPSRPEPAASPKPATPPELPATEALPEPLLPKVPAETIPHVLRKPQNIGRARRETQVSNAAIPSLVQMDLVQLADAYSKALEQREVAEITYQNIENLRGGGAGVTQNELRLAAVKLKSAERKWRLVRKIVESAIGSAEADLVSASAVVKKVRQANEKAKRTVPDAAVAVQQRAVDRAADRLEILRAILDH